MRVKVYDYDAAGNEILRCECELGKCFPDQAVFHDDEYYVALRELRQVGRYMVGGGASPPTLLTRS